MRQRTHPPSAATVAEGGGSKARPIHGSARQLQLCKEIFFAGFPCQQPFQRSSGNSGKTTTATASATASSPAVSSNASKGVRPLSKQFIRGFFQQYGTVESLFYDEARGMGSVVFADGADAESCYLAVHLSFLPMTTAEGGVGTPTWVQDRQGEDLTERKARAGDVLLCLEFAQCCPFVNPVLLTRDIFVDGGMAHCEVPGGELSRATLFHRFPQLLMPTNRTVGGAAPKLMVPVAPHVVMRWRAEEVEEEEEVSQADKHTSRVEVIEDVDADADADNDGTSGSNGANRKGNVKTIADQATATKKEKKYTRRVVAVGPDFPGRSIEPIEVEEALWQLLRPSHKSPPLSMTDSTVDVTVLDLWWEYYNLYLVHKTQPAASRIDDVRFTYAQRPSLYQELLEVQRQGREYAHGDEAAAQQVLQRLVYDHQYHNILSYLTVKEKFKYDPAWASLMRDLYKPKVALQLEAWQSLMEEREAKQSAETEEGGAAAAEGKLSDSEVRRRRVVMRAIQDLHEPKPTKARDIEWVRRAEQTWLTMPRTTAAANVMENVRFLGKVRRGEIDRNGHDKDLSKRPPLPTHGTKGGNNGDKKSKDTEAEDEALDDSNNNPEAAYPSMSTRQKDEQFYEEVLQNLDGYVIIGTADELVAMCEDPKLFRYAKGHIGYEEARRRPSYWLAYLNALWVPLLAFLLLGFGSYYIVDRLGISKVNEMKLQEERQREFHVQLRRLLDQQQQILDASQQSGSNSNAAGRRAALQAMNETMRKAAEAARKAGGKFNFELRGDL